MANGALLETRVPDDLHPPKRHTIMKKKETSTMGQKDHWNEVYSREPDFFGEGPSDCAGIALDLFRESQIESVLELGCGQGRDSPTRWADS